MSVEVLELAGDLFDVAGSFVLVVLEGFGEGFEVPFWHFVAGGSLFELFGWTFAEPELFPGGFSEDFGGLLFVGRTTVERTLLSLSEDDPEELREEIDESLFFDLEAVLTIGDLDLVLVLLFLLVFSLRSQDQELPQHRLQPLRGSRSR